MKASWSDNPVNVVVLASGVNKVPLYDGYTPGYKSLLPYHGRASVQYVLDALSTVDAIGQICILGPQALLEKELANRPADDRITLAEGGETFLESLVTGLERFRSSPAVLFVTADIPLLKPAAVSDFLSGCAQAKTEYPHNVFVSAVPRTDYVGDFRRFTKPFNRFRDISVCHGNLFLADPDLLENPALRERVNRLYAGRKGIWSRFAPGWQVALAYLIGVDLLHILTLKQMADFASRHLGVGIIPVLVHHPEITMDVDEAEDYQFVQEQIEKTAERLVPCN
jgi:CTP:molybdopterin cytidylyltransferase MocA